MSKDKDPRLHGMDVRFNGRTLRARIACEPCPATSERFDALAKRMQTVARGPGLRMAVVTGSMNDAGSLLDATVNTDEPADALAKRLREALDKEEIGALVVIEELDPVGATMFWNKLFGVAEATVEQEKKRS